LYRISVEKEISSQTNSTMFVGIDVVLKKGVKVFGLSASSSKHITQHYS
jgi:hypothetical protein